MDDNGNYRMLNIRQIKMYLYIKSFCSNWVMQNISVNALAESLAAFLFLMQNVMHHLSKFVTLFIKQFKVQKKTSMFKQQGQACYQNKQETFKTQLCPNDKTATKYHIKKGSVCEEVKEYLHHLFQIYIRPRKLFRELVGTTQNQRASTQQI